MKTLKSYIKIFTFSCCVLTAKVSIGQTAYDYKNTAPKNQFPKFTAYIDSTVYSNKTIAGKIVFMNFWKSSCSPCIAEMEALDKMYRKLKGHENFEFLSFTPDDPETIEFLIDKYKISFPVLSLPEKSIRGIKFVMGYPTSLILNENGEVIYSRPGGSSTEKEAKKIVNEELFKQLQLALGHKPLKPFF